MLPVYARDAAEYAIAVESAPRQPLELKKEPIVPLIAVAFALMTPQPPVPPSAVPAVPPPAVVAAPAATTPPRVRHALILCGHPGDAEHAKAFADTVRKLRDGLAKTVGIPPERQHVVFGADAPKDLPGATGPATREAVAAAVAGVRKALGHGHRDGRQAWWNLPGPDLRAAEFGKLFPDVTCKEQVFVMTSSLGGYFVAPRARPRKTAATTPRRPGSPPPGSGTPRVPAGSSSISPRPSPSPKRASRSRRRTRK